MDTMMVKAAGRRTRRRHDEEFKKQVIEACLHPGVSVAAVALANGLNANMLRKWVRGHGQDLMPVVRKDELPAERRAAMVPVTVAANSEPCSTVLEIRIDLRRGGTTVQMAWPLEAAASLGQCLRELLR